MILNLPDSHARYDLSLAQGAVVDLRPPRDGVRLVACDGALWITQTGDPQDHVLSAGESFHTRGEGLVVVQALEPSRLGL